VTSSANANPVYDLQTVRSAFPIADQLTYLNHAAISPLPRPTEQAMLEATAQLARDPFALFHPKPGQDDLFTTFSATMGQLINAEHLHEIAGTQSTSAGINAVAGAIPWEMGDNLLFCDVEFPSNAYPWMVLERRGVECRIVPPTDGGASVAAFTDHVDERTRLIAVSAVQYLTGHRADLAALGAFCRERGILFCVDAIQAVGHMPIDVQAMQIDVLVTGGQKSLMGPPGQGFLYVRDAVAATMQPTTIGPNATEDWMHWAKYDLTPREGASRLLMGTPNLTGMVGLVASVRFLCDLGIAHIDQWTRHLSQLAIETIEPRGYPAITPTDPALLGPITTFRIGHADPADPASVEQANQQALALMDYLTEHAVRVTKHWDRDRVPHLRISTHCYNTEEDIIRVGHLLGEFQP
jgi:cysteine desulfurase/selenocysteine lyase